MNHVDRVARLPHLNTQADEDIPLPNARWGALPDNGVVIDFITGQSWVQGQVNLGNYIIQLVNPAAVFTTGLAQMTLFSSQFIKSVYYAYIFGFGITVPRESPISEDMFPIFRNITKWSDGLLNQYEDMRNYFYQGLLDFRYKIIRALVVYVNGTKYTFEHGLDDTLLNILNNVRFTTGDAIRFHWPTNLAQQHALHDIVLDRVKSFSQHKPDAVAIVNNVNNDITNSADVFASGIEYSFPPQVGHSLTLGNFGHIPEVYFYSFSHPCMVNINWHMQTEDIQKVGYYGKVYYDTLTMLPTRRIDVGKNKTITNISRDLDNRGIGLGLQEGSVIENYTNLDRNGKLFDKNLTWGYIYTEVGQVPLMKKLVKELKGQDILNAYDFPKTAPELQENLNNVFDVNLTETINVTLELKRSSGGELLSGFMQITRGVQKYDISIKVIDSVSLANRFHKLVSLQLWTKGISNNSHGGSINKPVTVRLNNFKTLPNGASAGVHFVTGGQPGEQYDGARLHDIQLIWLHLYREDIPVPTDGLLNPLPNFFGFINKMRIASTTLPIFTYNPYLKYPKFDAFDLFDWTVIAPNLMFFSARLVFRKIAAGEAGFKDYWAPLVNGKRKNHFYSEDDADRYLNTHETYNILKGSIRMAHSDSYYYPFLYQFSKNVAEIKLNILDEVKIVNNTTTVKYRDYQGVHTDIIDINNRFIFAGNGANNGFVAFFDSTEFVRTDKYNKSMLDANIHNYKPIIHLESFTNCFKGTGDDFTLYGVKITEQGLAQNNFTEACKAKLRKRKILYPNSY